MATLRKQGKSQEAEALGKKVSEIDKIWKDKIARAYSCFFQMEKENCTKRQDIISHLSGIRNRSKSSTKMVERSRK